MHFTFHWFVHIHNLEQVLFHMWFTMWNKILLKKPIGIQLVKKLSAFYGFQWFSIMFTRAWHLNLSVNLSSTNESFKFPLIGEELPNTRNTRCTQHPIWMWNSMYYTVQTSTNTRITDQHHHACLYHAEKLAKVEHTTKPVTLCIQLQATCILAKKLKSGKQQWFHSLPMILRQKIVLPKWVMKHSHPLLKGKI